MKLTTLVEIGFCQSYGDADFRISMEIADLSRARFNELLTGMCWAMHEMQDIWLREQRRTDPAQQAAESK